MDAQPCSTYAAVHNTSGHKHAVEAKGMEHTRVQHSLRTIRWRLPSLTTLWSSRNAWSQYAITPGERLAASVKVIGIPACPLHLLASNTVAENSVPRMTAAANAAMTAAGITLSTGTEEKTLPPIHMPKKPDLGHDLVNSPSDPRNVNNPF